MWELNEAVGEIIFNKNKKPSAFLLKASVHKRTE
jgi:hypothetical protein